MKSDKNKMLLEIAGKTVIERSVGAFADLEGIDEIIVTARKEELGIYKELFKNKRITFVIGGETRQESVKNAVDTVDGADLIIIHDGARPFVKKEDILKTIEAAKKYGAAAVGAPVKDTIKVTDKDGFVIDTPERSTLVAIQTPQVFSLELYKKAMKKAKEDEKDFTDDCQLIEYIGERVKTVIGSYSNIKITTPEDIAAAEGIIRSEKL